MQPADFEDAIQRIVEHDPRYPREAYVFLREGLAYCQASLAKKKGDKISGIRHVTGQELLESLRQYALDQFGPLTLMVLNEWGIRQTGDFGELVFNMIEHQLLRKTEQDRREDFQGGYDFQTAFREPFLPSSRRTAEAAAQATQLPSGEPEVKQPSPKQAKAHPGE